MNISEDNQINYWAGGEEYKYDSPKPKRSIRKKLFIVISFLLILAITPTLILSFINLDTSNNRDVSIASSNQALTQDENNEPEVHKVIIEEPKTTSIQTAVIKNDSYWKISKRICESGKFYISIRDQNKAKALFEGDTVTVNCSL